MIPADVSNSRVLRDETSQSAGGDFNTAVDLSSSLTDAGQINWYAKAFPEKEKIDNKQTVLKKCILTIMK
ncbi:hypothetical protein I3B33_06580 [Salmonella enterica]|nr:hypothetical protein [Salmonella enterica]ECI7592143.1 hypothetical protein [Salmonella enterica subsp. enterica]EDP9478231.1 hypothetical protein [Salmonella enterica subsp. enterica serovar Havana]EAQ5908396.1 hypothetical protein [Salmonella enterica]EAZ5304325.1 hypothetical protein [Salmonella enterica]EDS5972587.1 hypothetical protein [Salmonella enterica subsp. enterica]